MQRPSNTLLILTAVVTTLIALTRFSLAVDPAVKCTATKLKAAGKELSAKMGCYATAKKLATGVDGSCLSNAQTKADARINKAGTSDCQGTAIDIDAAVDTCITAFLVDDPNDGDCPANSAKVIGKGAKVELSCQAKETTKPGTFAACDTKGDGKTSAGLTKAGGCVDPNAVGADIDTCNTAIVAIVGLAPTTTTTLPCGTFLTKWGSMGSGDGEFNIPLNVGLDASGNVYVADRSNDRIQKFDPNGVFLAKWGSTGSGDGQFQFPQAVAVDGSGNVFVTDLSNHRVQKFDPNGTFLLKWGTMGSGDGQFNVTTGVAVDGSGNVFVADYNNSRIQKFDPNGLFLTKWGSAGSGDGQFNTPAGVAVDESGSVFVVDVNNNRIQKFTNTGSFLIKWGNFGNGDGQFFTPQGVAVDGNGSVFVTDNTNNRIQKFTNNGTFLTKWGSSGSGDGQFALGPVGVGVDGSGHVFVSDNSANRIQKFACPLPASPSCSGVADGTPCLSVQICGSPAPCKVCMGGVCVVNTPHFDAGCNPSCGVANGICGAAGFCCNVSCTNVGGLSAFADCVSCCASGTCP